jgi:hypothetical protein
METVLNTVGLLCAGLVIWNYLPARSAPKAAGEGARFPLDKASWSESPKTVVLALSTECRYCLESAGFYRVLGRMAHPERFRVIAVLREPLQESQPRLESLGIALLKDVRHADFAALRVHATPTLFIVNRDGNVDAAWTGKLSAAQEAEVLTLLGAASPPQGGMIMPPQPPPTVPASELRALLRDPETVLVDIRDRDSFAAGHIAEALSLPWDELHARAPHELPQDKLLVVYCLNATRCGPKREGAAGLCGLIQSVLSRLGFERVRYVADEIPVLARQGIPVVETACQ